LSLLLKLLPRLNLKATAIHNGIDPDELSGRNVIRGTNLNSYILCIAHQNEKKNLQLLIQAFAERLEPVWREASAEMGAALPVIFTAHSVPTRTIHAGDPYEKQAKETARLVAERIAGLTPELRHFAFQSQGMSGGPWLGPTVESAMLEQKRQGRKGVVIAPIGFVCDHVDVLYDIDIGFREFGKEQGLKMWRPESLNTSATFIAALAKLASTRLALASGIVSLA